MIRLAPTEGLNRYEAHAYGSHFVVDRDASQPCLPGVPTPAAWIVTRDGTEIGRATSLPRAREIVEAALLETQAA